MGDQDDGDAVDKNIDESKQVNPYAIFPSNKIKGILLDEDRLGSWPKEAVKMVNAASVKFMQDIVCETKGIGGSHTVRSLDHLKEALKKPSFQFAQGALEGLQEKPAQRSTRLAAAPPRKKAKPNPPKAIDPADLKEVMKTIKTEASVPQQVVLDEEDYD